MVAVSLHCKSCDIRYPKREKRSGLACPQCGAACLLSNRDADMDIGELESMERHAAFEEYYAAHCRRQIVAAAAEFARPSSRPWIEEDDRG